MMFYATLFTNFLNVASASSDEKMLSTYLPLRFCCKILALITLEARYSAADGGSRVAVLRLTEELEKPLHHKTGVSAKRCDKH